MPKTIPAPGAKKPSAKAGAKPGKIVVKQATASAIRESLGVTRSEAEIGASAIRSVRASALAKGTASKTVREKKRTLSRPATTS